MTRALLIVLAACGGGDKPPEPTTEPPPKLAPSKLSAATRLGRLSADDQRVLCEELAPLRPPDVMIKSACYMTSLASAKGADDAALQTACRRSVDACIANPPPEVTACPLSGLLKMGCGNATVGEIRACMVASNELMSSFVRTDACSGLRAGDRAYVSNVGKTLTSPQCRAVMKDCRTDEGDADYQKRVLGPVERFKAEGCACADRACAIKVDDEFRKWSATLDLPPTSRPYGASEHKFKVMTAEYSLCLGKFAPERTKK
jgi:hypothetical protein